eukprot:GHVS01038602.1.p1 GENE.GHVS01038602.1~~GHVS01038602.1.p1  ORF type:complete len:872 (-),score=263.50 GHVS01038602.1:109-2469(-)
MASIATEEQEDEEDEDDTTATGYLFVGDSKKSNMSTECDNSLVPSEHIAEQQEQFKQHMNDCIITTTSETKQQQQLSVGISGECEESIIPSEWNSSDLVEELMSAHNNSSFSFQCNSLSIMDECAFDLWPTIVGGGGQPTTGYNNAAAAVVISLPSLLSPRGGGRECTLPSVADEGEVLEVYRDALHLQSQGMGAAPWLRFAVWNYRTGFKGLLDKQQVAEVVVVVTSLGVVRRQYCASQRAMHFLDCKGIEYFIIDINQDIGRDLPDLRLFSSWKRRGLLLPAGPAAGRTDDAPQALIPQVVVDGVAVGDAVAVQDLEDDGDMDWILHRRACGRCLRDRRPESRRCRHCGVRFRSIVKDIHLDDEKDGDWESQEEGEDVRHERSWSAAVSPWHEIVVWRCKLIGSCWNRMPKMTLRRRGGKTLVSEYTNDAGLVMQVHRTESGRRVPILVDETLQRELEILQEALDGRLATAAAAGVDNTAGDGGKIWKELEEDVAEVFEEFVSPVATTTATVDDSPGVRSDLVDCHDDDNNATTVVVVLGGEEEEVITEVYEHDGEKAEEKEEEKELNKPVGSAGPVAGSRGGAMAFARGLTRGLTTDVFRRMSTLKTNYIDGGKVVMMGTRMVEASDDSNDRSNSNHMSDSSNDSNHRMNRSDSSVGGVDKKCVDISSKQDGNNCIVTNNSLTTAVAVSSVDDLIDGSTQQQKQQQEQQQEQQQLTDKKIESSKSLNFERREEKEKDESTVKQLVSYSRTTSNTALLLSDKLPTTPTQQQEGQMSSNSSIISS